MALGVILCISTPPQTDASADAVRLPNFDRRPQYAAPHRLMDPQHQAARARLRAQVPDVDIDLNPRLGTCHWIRARHGWLSGPRGRGGAISAAALRAVPEADPHRVLKAFLNEHAALLGHDARALDQARLARDEVTRHNGLRTAVWQQVVDGIPVFDALLVGRITRDGELVSVSDDFLPDPAAAAGRARPRAPAGLSAGQAVACAAAALGETVSPGSVIPRVAGWSGHRDYRCYGAPEVQGEIAVRRVWLPLDRDTLRLCWEVILKTRRLARRFRVLVDADTGKALLGRDLTRDLSDATYHVFTGDSPMPMWPGLATPQTNQPPLVERTWVTLAALSTNASPLGWMGDGTNETRGNNVAAHLDRDGNDEADLPRPQGHPERTFDFPFDPTREPAANAAAAVVQAFYWCNWMHDRLYELGFTEEAGNYQEDNVGRGGLGNDAIQADVQDSDLINNSNFDGAPDGLPGRVQLGIFTYPDPDRDEAFDAGVLLHELTHGLTERLIPGEDPLESTQGRGLAEGWSDFYALALLSQPEDDPDGVYPIGGYVTYRGTSYAQNYYFGIRRYPYCTDLLKNPLTFKDIDPTLASNHPGIPRNPVINTPPGHYYSQGELWCSLLWEIRANLIRKYGAVPGSQRALQLVTDALKQTPAEPTFVQARDALLIAEHINGNADFFEIWAGFAKRGLGQSAVGPPNYSTVGVSEAFDVPDYLAISPSTGFTAAGPVEGPFIPASQTYVLTNRGPGAVSWTALYGGAWLVVSPGESIQTSGGPATVLTVTITAAAETLPAGIYTDTLVLTNHTTGVGQALPITLRIGQPDAFTEIFEANDNDLDFTSFLFTPDGSVSYYTVCREAVTGFSADPQSGTPVSLGDDSTVEVILTDGKTVGVYGTNAGSLFIGSNGYLTFGQADLEGGESLVQHYSRVRIAALFDDLDPTAGGTVSWQQLSNRVAVTFLDVPEYHQSNSNSFQIELFFDGTLRLTYLAIAASDGLVGLSAGGGQPPSYLESDFSAYPGCSDPLVVTLPPEATEGDGLLAEPGEVLLPRLLATNLIVALASSDPGELAIPATVTVPAGAARASFDLWVTDDALLDGSQSVTVQASAPGIRKGTRSIPIHDNETATLSILPPAYATEGSLQITGSVRVSASPAKAVTVHLSASDTNSVALPATVVIPSHQLAAAFPLTVFDNGAIDGLRTVTLGARVTGWTAGSGLLQIEDNEDTLLRLSLPPQAHEDDGPLANAGTVHIDGTLLTNLPVALTTSHPGSLTVPASVLVPAGQTSAFFDLTLHDNTLTNESSQVTVQAAAAGFQNAAAALTILDDEMPDVPSQPNPPDLATAVPIYRNLSWTIPGRELIVNGGFEAGTLAGWTRENTGAGDWHLNDGTYNPASADGPQPAFDGQFSVVSDRTEPGSRVLFQDFALPVGAGPVALQWSHCLRNFAGAYGPGQQFRVEILNAAQAVLAVPFATAEGDPLLGNWTSRRYDLSGFKGQTLRIVFLVEDGAGPLNVHLDDISVLAPPDNLTAFDVYFGTNAVPGPGQWLGTTTNLFWDLPLLSPLTPYYWQVVARRLGQIPGPIWRFTTWGVHTFELSPIGSPQVQCAPIPIAITARDALANIVTNFTGPVALSARIAVPDVLIDHAATTAPFPLAAASHDARSQVIYLASELGDPRSLAALSLEVIAAPGQTLSHWTLRMKHTPHADFTEPAWETEGWTVVCQGHPTITDETWVTFPLDPPFPYDGENNLMIDFSFNNTSASFDGWCSAVNTLAPRALNARSDSLHGDPLAWSGNTPAPAATSQVPAIRLTSSKPAQPIQPATSGTFADGTWRGHVVLTNPAPDVSVGCLYEPGLSAFTPPFRVAADGDCDGMPDDWELDHRLNPNSGVDAAADADQDGVDNLHEFLANTDPHDAGSRCLIVAIERHGTAVYIRVATALERRYLVQRATGLVPPIVWTNLTEALAGTGNVVEIIDASPPVATNSFYRVQALR